MDKKGLLRVLDANFNRSKEALRVIEDIFRFVSKNDELRKKSRSLRHSLDALTKNKLFQKAVLSRNSTYDLGRKIDTLELNRKTSRDVLYANLQRAKESVRVLEEFFKIVFPSQVKLLKKIRYDIYSFEKRVYSVRNPM